LLRIVHVGALIFRYTGVTVVHEEVDGIEKVVIWLEILVVPSTLGWPSQRVYGVEFAANVSVSYFVV
jgi:hypothetical protein